MGPRVVQLGLSISRARHHPAIVDQIRAHRALTAVICCLRFKQSFSHERTVIHGAIQQSRGEHQSGERGGVLSTPSVWRPHGPWFAACVRILPLPRGCSSDCRHRVAPHLRVFGIPCRSERGCDLACPFRSQPTPVTPRRAALALI
jgi:hypothetical protein